MKSRKMKMIAPLLTLVFAIGGAFATSAFNSNAETLAPTWGYLDHPEPCEMEIQCDTEVGPVCRADNGLQVFGKENESDTTCTTLVFEFNPNN